MVDQILPLRFKLNQDKLKDFRVVVLPFAWRNPFEDLASEAARALRKEQIKLSLPYRQLNTVLSALTPSLVHPFEGSGYNRRLMIFDNEARPSVNQIYYVLREWALLWAEDFLAQKKINQPNWISEFQSKLDAVQVDWQPHNVWDLWVKGGEDDRLKYSAIPSLLASLLHEKRCQIGKHSIYWQLVQDRTNKVCAMSIPQTSTPGDGEIGTFAYVLEFAVQTQAGHRLPSHAWINLFTHCRRFLDEGIGHADPRSLHTILVRANEPRLDNWPVSRAYASLGIYIRGNQRVEWEGEAAQLLNHLKIQRPLLEPESVLRNPQQYRDINDPRNDIYLAVYREGMEPDHALETGFSPVERQYATDAVAQLLSDFLIPADPLVRDTFVLPVESRHRPSIVQPPRLLERHHSTLERAKAIRAETGQPRRASEVARDLEQTTRMRLLNGKPLHIMLCHRGSQREPRTRDMLKEHMRTIYGIRTQDKWPEGLIITEHEIPDMLEQPLDSDEMSHDDSLPHEREDWRTRIEKEWERKKTAWQEQITQWMQSDQVPLSAQNAFRLALVEMPDQTNKRSLHPDRQIKGAVRAAFLAHDISSQMIFTLPSRAIKYKARARNAAMELVLRHTGLLYGTLSDLCAETGLGISPAISSDLTVIGLYRSRNYKTKWRKRKIDIDFPMAVRLRPGSRVEARLPGMNSWEPYLPVTMTLGRRFLQRRDLALQEEDTRRFLWEVLGEETNQPTLVIVAADDWRWKIWPQLQDKKIQPNCVELPMSQPNMGTITPETHPYLRIVRVRERGTLGEITDYVRLLGEGDAASSQVGFVEELSLFEDTYAPGPLRTFLSIGKRAETQKNLTPDALKHEEGGGIANKQQIPLEIVPFFLQAGDNAIAWARLTHVLRDMCPWWPRGTMRYPYPIHMAYKAVEDALWALGPKLEDSEEL